MLIGMAPSDRVVAITIHKAVVVEVVCGNPRVSRVAVKDREPVAKEHVG